MFISVSLSPSLPPLTESLESHQRSYELGVQRAYQRRNKDVLAWVKKRRRNIRREDLISFLCGKAPPPRNPRRDAQTPKHGHALSVMSPGRPPSTESGSSVEADLQPFREAIALHGETDTHTHCTVTQTHTHTALAYTHTPES